MLSVSVLCRCGKGTSFCKISGPIISAIIMTVRFNYFILFLLNDVSQSVCMFTRVKKCTLKGSKEAEKTSEPLYGYYMITAGVVVAVVNDC